MIHIPSAPGRLGKHKRCGAACADAGAGSDAGLFADRVCDHARSHVRHHGVGLHPHGACAKGVPNRWVVMKHGLRNALLPVLTSFMVDLGQLLGGVTVIEAVFNYRGIGNMMFEAVKSRDYPLLQGGFLLFTITILILNILTELLYPYMDPRLRRTTA